MKHSSTLYVGLEVHKESIAVAYVSDAWPSAPSRSPGSRFDSPRQLMSYLGLTPSESSTGNIRRLGGPRAII